MPIHGIGIDILHVPRLAALIERRGLSRLASRILSPVELDAFRSLTGQIENKGALAANERGRMESIVRFLGVRWTVKEAAYKALYPLRPTWKELTYTSFDAKNGLKPKLVYASLSPDTTAAKLHVSASHDGEHIVATVLVENSHRLHWLSTAATAPLSTPLHFVLIQSLAGQYVVLYSDESDPGEGGPDQLLCWVPTRVSKQKKGEWKYRATGERESRLVQGQSQRTRG